MGVAGEYDGEYEKKAHETGMNGSKMHLLTIMKVVTLNEQFEHVNCGFQSIVNSDDEEYKQRAH